jgi:hypothetical protein
MGRVNYLSFPVEAGFYTEFFPRYALDLSGPQRIFAEDFSQRCVFTFRQTTQSQPQDSKEETIMAKSAFKAIVALATLLSAVLNLMSHSRTSAEPDRPVQQKTVSAPVAPSDSGNKTCGAPVRGCPSVRGSIAQ